MNNDTVGPKSDDDSGAEPSGSNTIPPRGPERETKGAAAFLRSRRTAVAITATTLVVGGFVAWLGYTAYEAKDNLEAARDHAQSAKRRSPGRRYGSRRVCRGGSRSRSIGRIRQHPFTPLEHHRRNSRHRVAVRVDAPDDRGRSGAYA